MRYDEIYLDQYYVTMAFIVAYLKCITFEAWFFDGYRSTNVFDSTIDWKNSSSDKIVGIMEFSPNSLIDLITYLWTHKSTYKHAKTICHFMRMKTAIATKFVEFCTALECHVKSISCWHVYTEKIDFADAYNT